VRTWKTVWDERRLDPGRGSVLAQLMAADGLDTGFGSVAEAGWRDFVHRVAGTLGLAAGDSVFEVGCGAGAFLYELALAGIAVAGADQSAALVGYARAAMPDGRFDVGEAAGLAVVPQFDVVLSCGVFLYFPSLEYASTVIERMAAKARRGVAILDIPDRAKQTHALAERRAMLGPEEYEARYAGLDHLFYEKDWIAGRMETCGLTNIRVEDQSIPGYGNARFRFNAFAARA